LKKLIAALLLFIYLFSISGQIAIHQYFSYLSDRFFNEQTSKGLYNIHDLVEVKLPVNMPGIADWTAYENISGQIKFGNSTYNYVKMKITKDVLYLMCIPDYSTTTFSTQNVINAKQVANVPVPKKEHVPYGKTTVLDNFNFAFVQFTFFSPVESPVKKALQSYQQLIRQSLDIPEQPPKFCC
jgi:hypothetical protein